ncbi:MAG TPA: bifunctional pyr operon transcriptional regulator/uracil phosphoribosyltransferase PyrR [Candidatus Dormibacteraeota bacterium]|nr:bifunctional pyr operon transcriptional regulator/uracil phosphoribosyltransferase PyrR [Candidatus Dormibacteraeota bacterium]
MPVVEKKQVMSATEMDRTLQRLAHEIVERTADIDRLALVGIRRRGIPLAERLARNIGAVVGHPISVGSIDITLYRDDLSTTATQPEVHASDIPAVDDRDILLVDDVLYTARTIRAAINGLFDLGRPRRIRLCVLIDRGHRELPIEASFVGRVVQTTLSELVDVRLQEIDGEERVMLIDRVP